MITRKTLFATLLMATIATNVQAQENGFDLNAQRKESQEVNMIPGKKIDHQGIVINPTPHLLNVDKNKWLDLAQGVAVVDKKGKFSEDVKFLAAAKGGVKMTIDYGVKLAAKNGVKAVSGAYQLTVDGKGIHITGYDERGAYYALQTLRQLVGSDACKEEGKVPYVECSDYPDLPYRGVVEGFYGEPWSHQVRLSLIEYYGKNKLNAYLYGPKDDPFHSSPNWREPYPEKEAQNISELVQACRRNRVDFVWAIHPGKDIKWNEEDYQNLVRKLNLMYDLGVRAFAVFFDDISGEGANPAKQVELLNRLTQEFVKAKGDVAPLVMCPTDYSKLWANPKPTGSLAIFGNTLDPSINVFWTGDAVCSDLTKETLDWVNSRIKRPAYYWWNFPVTDYARHIIMQGPTYGLENTLTDKDLCGLVSNPMEHGEASKLALYGVADYTWNIAQYNALDNWERGLVDLTPEAHDAYRTFAIHSCDTETGYRRIESWETKPFKVDNYTDAEFEAMRKEFEQVSKTPEEMESNCKNQLLLKELRPWLTEFGKLGKRGEKAMQLIKEYKAGNDEAFWDGYVNNRMSGEDLAAYEAHKSGTMVLQPFYQTAMDDMASGFYKKLTGKVPAFYQGVGTYATVKTTQSKLMFDNDTTTYYHSGTGQHTDDWVGADLGCVRPVHEVRILQGRNSVDDVDYFDHAVLECSEDGKNWNALTDELDKQYVINWKGGQAVNARYVRLRKLPSDKTNWIAVRSFDVNPAGNFAFDENPCTSQTSQGTFGFGVEKGVKGYTLLLKVMPGEKVTFNQYNAKGKQIASAPIGSSFASVQLENKAAKVEIVGNVEIFEIIPQR